MNMITIQRLTASEQIENACALLYEVYIQQKNWQFSADNPSKLRVEIRNNKRILVDRFIENSIWFGAFDDEKLVGCIRLAGLDENNQLEIEGYPSSQPIHHYIPSEEKGRCYDMQKLATKESYVGRGIVKRLFLACFRFCEENQYHVIAFTANGYLKTLCKKISFPLKQEQAFKYEPHDPSAVNFYFADYKKTEVRETLKNLEYLENDISNNARSIFKALQTVESILPTPIYWMDSQGVVLGINELGLKAMGTTREIIGKKPYEFYKDEIAEHILKHNDAVMRQGEILSQEEWIEDITTKERKCFSSVKAPLYDDEGSIIGIVGTSIDITAQKEAETLRLENERHQIALQEKEHFAMLARKVAHDINSPLASLKMMLDRCEELHENKRSILRRATEGAIDIANNLISSYQKKENSSSAEIELRQPLLISDLLIHLLSEKKVQYEQHPVIFETNIASNAQFAFIHAQKIEFRRTLSNLINNAVDALEGKKDGVVTVKLTADADFVSAKVKDNGKGMSRDKVEKMLEHQGFTEGKENGHGLGLQQVWDTLDYNQGTMAVQSTLREGTSIQLTFPRVAAPSWIAQKILLTPNSIIVILDDEESMHPAWDLRLSDFLTTNPSIQLHHFTHGQKAFDFLNKLSSEEKNRVIFLSDYELMNQDRNGLQIIEASQITQAILVTSYYSNPKVREAAAKLNVSILPKQMAAVIPIEVNAKVGVTRVVS